MRRYETIFIADPVIPDDELATLRQSLASTITERKGEMLQEEDWGKKKLAYEIRKRREGHYIRFEYACDDQTLPMELERRMRISEPVMRFITVRIDNDKKRLIWEQHVAKREAEKAERAAAAAAAAAEAEAKSDDADAQEDSAETPASSSSTEEKASGEATT